MKVILLKSSSFPNYLISIYVFKVTYACCVCMVEVLYDDMCLHIIKFFPVS